MTWIGNHVLSLYLIISIAVLIYTTPIIILWRPFTVDLIYSITRLNPLNLTEARSLTSLYSVNSSSTLTVNEIGHLQDVIHLVQSACILWSIACLSLLLIFALAYRRSHRHYPFGLIEKTTKICLISTLVISALGIFLWRNFFTWFHQIFFPQGNWSFPTDSLLITFFPEIFWQSAFMLYLCLFLLTTVSLILASSSYKNESKGQV